MRERTTDINRKFSGVWIEKDIYLNDNLTPLDMIIFSEIRSLARNEKGCTAGNKYLASFCKCSESKVSKSISKLIKLGYIEKVSFDGRTRVLRAKK